MFLSLSNHCTQDAPKLDILKVNIVLKLCIFLYPHLYNNGIWAKLHFILFGMQLNAATG